MIIETVFNAIFNLIFSVIGLMPSFPSVTYDEALEFFKVLSVVNTFIDLKLFFSCILIMLISLNVEMLWGFVEWVYKKIPGVD